LWALPQITIVVVCYSFVLSLFFYNVSYFYANELEYSDLQLSQGSFFFESDFLAKLIFSLSFLVSFYSLRRDLRPNWKGFNLTIIFLTAFYVALGLISVFLVDSWPGPQISYLEMFLFPLHAINFARLLYALTYLEIEPSRIL
jgi:hypothetical protein